MEGSTIEMPAPNPRQLSEFLQAGLQEGAEALHCGGEFLTDLIRDIFLETIAEVRAHEGTIWILDASRSNLIPRFNSGARASEFVGKYSHNIRSGMIGMVAATQLPICENEVHRHTNHNPALDNALGLRTCSMLAVPLCFAGEVRGVISAVQLKAASSDEPDPPGFTLANLRRIQRLADLSARLIEHALLIALLEPELAG